MTTLKNVLLINAVSSGATGLGLALVPGLFTTLFEVSNTLPFVGVGIFLLAFATLVFAVSRKNILSESAVRLIVVLDCSWVFVSIGVVLFQFFNLSALGYFFISAVAAWVGLMAFLQFKGLKQLAVSK